jgi:hypothetical protein
VDEPQDWIRISSSDATQTNCNWIAYLNDSFRLFAFGIDNDDGEAGGEGVSSTTVSTQVLSLANNLPPTSTPRRSYGTKNTLTAVLGVLMTICS